MKRRYERPSAYIEEFTPNEYVAACGDRGTIYKFKCTAERHHIMHVEKRMKQVSQMILFRIAIIFLNQQESNIGGVQHGIHQRQ